MRQTLHAAMIAEDVPARFARWNGSKSNLALRFACARQDFDAWRPPTLPHRLQCSTLGRPGLHRRVRHGYGCFPRTHRRQISFSHRLIAEQ